MREMKDSGVKYLGTIPKNWNITKIKFAVNESINCGAGEEAQDFSNDSIRYIRISDFDKNGNIDEENAVYIPFVKGKKYIIKRGDILAATAGGTVGKTLLFNGLNEQACYAGYLAKIRTNEKIMNNKYLLYQMRCNIMDDFRQYAVKKSTIENISASTYSNMSVVLAPNIEQKFIVEFLDKRCAEIDGITKDLQEQIETLENYKKSVITEAVTKGLNPDVKMKDSKIRYIGKMPQHWDTDKGKFIFQYKQKPVRTDDGVITCFRDGEVTLRSNRREDGFTISEKEIGYQGIDKGDLIVHGMDGFAGAIGISDSRGKASPVLNVLETKNSKRFYMYYLRSMALRGVFEALSTGIRVRTCDTNWGKLREIVYLLPPINEQKEIANYLDTKCAEINDIIKNKKEQLETLEEYKKSLIYEYVTGKKEVINA